MKRRTRRIFSESAIIGGKISLLVRMVEIDAIWGVPLVVVAVEDVIAIEQVCLLGLLLEERDKAFQVPPVCLVVGDFRFLCVTRFQDKFDFFGLTQLAHAKVGKELPCLLLLGLRAVSNGCARLVNDHIIELYEKVGGNVVSVEEVPEEETHRYGIVGIGDDISDEGFRITSMVEKPAPGTAPSNWFINGRYILQPEIFSILARQERGAGNEIQLTDAMLNLAKDQQFAGYRFQGNTYDCGSKEGFIKANVSFALLREDIRHKVEDDIRRMIAQL